MRQQSTTRKGIWAFESREGLILSSLSVTVVFCIAVLGTAVTCTAPDVTVPRSSSTASDSTPEPMTVTGSVMTVKDTSPPGRYDAPRRFLIAVKTDGGRRVNVSYMAYPPSPLKDREKVRLLFHAGTIRAGDYLRARGLYYRNRNLLQVSGAGDFIETYPEKP